MCQSLAVTLSLACDAFDSMDMPLERAYEAFVSLHDSRVGVQAVDASTEPLLNDGRRL